jgi:dipeptidyl aminopeptidase/acylaminoacyl peptidase
VVCDRDSEFQRLARFDMATMTPKYLTTAIPWDVEHISASEDGKWIAFSTNENGLSKLYLLDTATDKYRPLGNAPAGVIGSLAFHPDGRTLALEVNAARSADDVYSIDIATEKLDRWTASETGGLNPANFAEPTLVKWKSFDGREISGFLYAPDPAKFPGKRPVVIDIHGGP